MMKKTLQRNCARSSVTNVISLMKYTLHLISLSILLEKPDMNFEPNVGMEHLLN